MLFPPLFRTPGIGFFNAPKVHRDQREQEIPISYNVFFGSIHGFGSLKTTPLASPVQCAFPPEASPPRGNTLYYASFKACVRSDFFSLSSHEAVLATEVKSGKRAVSSTVREYKARKEIPKVKEMAFLSAKFNDAILMLWQQASGHGQCAAPSCTNAAKGIVHQPLCCSSAGYYGLVDGEEMRHLMLAVARQVLELDTVAKLRGAIGASAQDAFINSLAIPVCSSASGRCSREIRLCMANFMDSQKVASLSSDEGYDTKETFSDHWRNPTIKSHPHCSGQTHKPSSRPRRNRSALPGQSASERAVDDSIIVRVSAYIGRPSIDPKEQPSAYQLSNLVFASSWPMTLFPLNITSTEALRLFEQICAFHEHRILEEGDFRCAICPTAVRATTLLHRPISLKRDNNHGPFTSQLRETLFNLHRYLRGRWDYPSITASLGNDGLPHINDFVVPLCKRNSVCEEVARIAAALFIDRQVPGDYADQVLLPALGCDTDLSRGVNSEIDDDPPKCLVRRLGECRLSKDAQEQNLDIPEHAGNQTMTVYHLKQCVESASTWEDVRQWIKHALGVDIIVRGGDEIVISSLNVQSSTGDNGLSCETAEEVAEGVPQLNTGGLRSVEGTPTLSSAQSSQRIDSRVYTYSLGNASSADIANEGQPTWGGFPLSKTSLKLLKAGAHKTTLILPVLSMNLARVMEQSLLEEDGCASERTKPELNTLARRSMYMHERYRKNGVDGEKYARRTAMNEGTAGENRTLESELL
ncbi:hypothetical protein KEM54_000055 [Ascosphaera aggregata]|nr:hypothetical protein KEM54_000055 [Ascosphaera aggregata]